MRSLRARLLAAVGTVTLLTSGLCWLFVFWATWEPPNYSRIEPGLYMGGYVDHPPRGTKAVLNLCEAEDPYRARVYAWEPIADAPPAPSIEWLAERVDWVQSQREAGQTVFVHCRAGVSRSGLVVVAYEMRQHGISRDDALALVREKRPGVRPNSAFMRLLAEWEDATHRPGGCGAVR